VNRVVSIIGNRHFVSDLSLLKADTLYDVKKDILPI